MSGPKRGSGPRSGLYSEERFTNWSPFDPFVAEARSASEKRPPRLSLELGRGCSLPIFESELRPGFVRPFSSRDVLDVISDVPPEHLEGLAGIFILGGTSKQQRARKIAYGHYIQDVRDTQGRIYLHPLPRRLLEQRWDRAPKPSVIREYTRFGASFQRGSDGWTLRFSETSLRLFYLYDVLLHEVGHHVERSVRPWPSRASERYATWYAQYHSSKLLGRDE